MHVVAEGSRANPSAARAGRCPVGIAHGLRALRPSEATALEHKHVGTNTLRIEQASDKDGSLKPTKTKQSRSVRLLEPLAADLKARGEETGLIFGSWNDSKLHDWRNRVFTPAVEDAGVKIKRPYELRHAAASLWLREGINYVQVAVWMGHSPAVLLSTYARLINDPDGDGRVDATKLIRDARQSVGIL